MEERLASGMSRVFRRGNAVLRDANPWSETTHRLLSHLQGKGFSRCPEFLGMTWDGREALSYVPGVCREEYPDLADADARLSSAFDMGRLIRSFHEASASFSQTDGDIWMLSYPGDELCDVICHNDLGAYNVTFVNGKPWGLIDFDACCPAPRRWDLVYAAYRFAPLSRSFFEPETGGYREYDPERDDAIRRLSVRSLYGGYGIEPKGEDAGLCARRLITLSDFIRKRADAGDEAFLRMQAEGHEGLYRTDARLLTERGERWFA